MTALYVVVTVFTVFLSLSKFRHLLHPQVLLTFMLVYMFPLDFIIRGESDVTIWLTATNLWTYQISILLVYLGIWGGSFVHSDYRQTREHFSGAGEWTVASRNQLIVFTVAATVILLLEILKRLSFANWSMQTMIGLSLVPRGTSPWSYQGGNIGDDNFIYAIAIILLPLSGMIYAYQIVLAGALARIGWIIGFAVVLLLLISDGARTPVFLVILTLVVTYWRLSRALALTKLLVTSALGVVLAVAAAAMYEFRSVGFDLFFLETTNVAGWTFYHQDDSFFRALNALDIATTSPERWSALEFFYTTAVNPIPRVFWPEKPILLADFWGNYKNEYVTISFVGELVAMYGVDFGLLLSVVTGMVVYFVLRRATKLIPEPGGIIVYFLMVLYGYMVLRSLFNITAFAYLPIFGFLLLWINKHQLQFLSRPKATALGVPNN